ncbi:PilZ domain-containing protein [Anaerobacterium chartisolvens]|uniref:PilZ domain-containing protein n=1 Tax=Anaerobacterium chartisolvens TaxID=1297424 RepID=A0A369B7X0_9FIRM|nr:PilZ domain-containing protein [Anaerobacterium chartisolvens]RCX16646.1 PilZ domain-containing protein [Anaerobacterium chartisolvens]
MRRIRHYQRYEATGKGTVKHSNTHGTDFTIKNISASGIKLFTAVKLDANSVILMDIHIHGTVSSFSKQVKGKILRRQKHHNSYFYAIHFIDLSHQEIIELDEYLRLNFGNSLLHHSPYEIEHEEYAIKQLMRDESL